MNKSLHALTLAGFVLLVTLFGNNQAVGQNVSAQISAREAWVGSPIVLQIKISNASKYSLPESFEIDGCDIRSAGRPSQSSQITIINGRRSESRSVTMQYLITPRREGKFQIPELEINVDGKAKATRPIPFVATKSETGDLLFAEVEGDKEKVYVGQPLKLKLKLWVKPFGDREQRIKLTENHMWQMISEQTSWGAFADRLQELAENRQRPGGETVLRKDDDGAEREYYLYEINATVYPNKPGKIDASDLQVVVNYPQALGRSRDPFESFFGGRSMVRDMMGDDFFSSPFGGRLTVSKSRPVVAEVNVDSTEVLAVPAKGQPADYRGAVGKYQIISQTESTSVSAGDPITLRIGVVGDGPMELVQAPPLHEIESLTNDFQVTDQSLAGFVQDETKVFVTTIRPRSEDVKEIPALPFSFFDPDKEAYQTVYSKPISIDVGTAESLDMDSIVSDVAAASAPNDTSSASNSTSVSGSTPRLDLQNDFSSSLVSSNAPKGSHWWYFAVVPPICWLVIALGRLASVLPSGLASMKSTKSQATSTIQSASTGSEIVEGLSAYVARRTKSSCPTYRHAAGKLRERNAYEVAVEFESFCQRLGTKTSATDQLEQSRHQALELLDSIDTALNNARQRPARKADSKKQGSLRSGVTASMVGLAFLCMASNGMASEELSPEKLQTILQEANSTYQAAEEIAGSQPAKARQMFASSANRYQLLVDKGVRNDRLFLNLGNAWCQSGEQTKAIVNYHRALWMNQSNTVARQNLSSIESAQSADSKDAPSATEDFSFNFGSASHLLNAAVSFLGHRSVGLIFAVSSVLFWLLISIKTVRPRLKMLRWSVVPMVLAIASGAAMYQLDKTEPNLAIVVDDNVELRSGDGEEFPVVAKLETTSGKSVSIIGQRTDWRKVRLPDGQIGWLPKASTVRVAL